VGMIEEVDGVITPAAVAWSRADGGGRGSHPVRKLDPGADSLRSDPRGPLHREAPALGAGRP